VNIYPTNDKHKQSVEKPWSFIARVDDRFLTYYITKEFTIHMDKSGFIAGPENIQSNL